MTRGNIEEYACCWGAIPGRCQPTKRRIPDEFIQMTGHYRKGLGLHTALTVAISFLECEKEELHMVKR